MNAFGIAFVGFRQGRVESVQRLPAPVRRLEQTRKAQPRPGPQAKRLFGLKRQPLLDLRLGVAAQSSQCPRQRVMAKRLQTDAFRRDAGQTPHRSRVVAAALVVGGEQEGRASIPGRLPRQPRDLDEDLLGLSPLAGLEHVRSARELRIEVGGDGPADLGESCHSNGKEKTGEKRMFHRRGRPAVRSRVDEISPRSPGS